MESLRSASWKRPDPWQWPLHSIQLNGATLPVAAEVNRRPAPHGQAANAKDLIAVADAAHVFTPGGVLGVANQVRPRNVVVTAKLATTQAGKIGFRAIRAGALYTGAILMVDPLHRRAGVQRVPLGAFIRMNRDALGDRPARCMTARDLLALFDDMAPVAMLPPISADRESRPPIAARRELTATRNDMLTSKAGPNRRHPVKCLIGHGYARIARPSRCGATGFDNSEKPPLPTYH